ncbi:unnamed protein product [Leptidea sinapis]|uniref:DBF4-type domain-containing protein n=1 Tax=Leptidea sinapis TaxID=189913 RepID=A0A5E4PZH0_9NEOP|nr:unnamed protein product [Leptidea sinapis]
MECDTKNIVRKNFCFYLDIQESAMSRCISQRLLDMGLREEVFLTSRVTHIVADRFRTEGPQWPRREGRARADAMLQRLYEHSPPKPVTHNYIQLTVQKAISLLDKLYDTFFVAPRKAHVNYFNKHFIKIEFLDKPCKPVFKEFDEWPRISLETYSVKENKEKNNSQETNAIPSNNNQKMTRKSRPRIKEKELKEEKGGYCEMCNIDYTDASLHRRSPHHLAFVRDHTNFLSLDSLINSGADVNTFLDKATPLNGERRSMRKLCNGEFEIKSRSSKQSQSPDTSSGNISPKRNGHDEEKKHNTRCSKKSSDSIPSEDRQYYKVVGVSTKLRSSGGFTKKKESVCNGTKPLVVKFRKVRRSELSVLSDEAEQFMFPKRASSSSSTSSDDEKLIVNKRKTDKPSQPPPTNERKRLARPLALKEESSEEDCWVEDKRKYRKRRAPPVVKRARPGPPSKIENLEPPTHSVEPKLQQLSLPNQDTEQLPNELQNIKKPQNEVSPTLEEPKEKCLKWEDGKLKYTPAVEQLEFAFESVPQSEPWFESFKRQDEDKIVARNVSNYFAIYTKSPKLPYEMGQLPSLKPNCCPLSDLVKQREEKPGPSRSYGTRGMKKRRMKKRTEAVIALESHPRKSPREHASTLAILGSAGLLHRHKHIIDDTKSTASEDTVVDTNVTSKTELVLSEAQEASERLQQFLSEVFDDASDYDVSDELIDSDSAVIPSKTILDVSSLVSECENCDLISNEIKQGTATRGRRGRFKKKNKTGWPSKKNKKKGSRTSSFECQSKTEGSVGQSSIDTDDDTISEVDQGLSETEITLTEDKDSKIDANTYTLKSDSQESRFPDPIIPMDVCEDKNNSEIVEEKCSEHNSKESDSDKRTTSESDDKEEKISKNKRALQGLCDWLPVIKVARVDSIAGRRLRSAGRSRSNRFR